MQTVLGLSMTSTSVGWVLLDGDGPDAATLDHDSFDIRSAADASAGDTSQHAAAARGAQAIATASGHKVGSLRVTWSECVEADATALVRSLEDLGFDNILEIPLSKAVQAWGIDVGCKNEHTKTGLCILEPDTATVMVVATGAGSVRTAVADTRGSAEDLVDWLRTVFRRDGWLPECLYLDGTLADLDEVTGPIGDALPIPIFDSVDAQMALARGAALATVTQVDIGVLPVPETRRKDPPRRDRPRPASAAEEVTASVAAEAPPNEPSNEPRKDPPRRERPWLVSHAKKLTTSAAAVAVVGTALSLAAGSALNVENVSAQAAEPAASGASVTSTSVHTAPAPVSARPAPQVQPLAAEPPPVPPAPPEAPALPAEPVANLAPEPVSVPVPQQTVSAAPPVSVPAEAPAAQPPTPHLAAPVAPGPVAPPPAAALAAPPAPIAPPPAVAPLPADPAVPPPPPDPIQVVLSPLFGGLP